MSGGREVDDELLQSLGFDLTTQPDSHPIMGQPAQQRASGVVVPQGLSEPVVVNVGGQPDVLRRLSSPMTVTALVTVFGILSTVVGFLSTYIFATKADLVDQRMAIEAKIDDVEKRHAERLRLLEQEIVRRGEWMKQTTGHLREIKQDARDVVEALERRRWVQSRRRAQGGGAQ